MRQAVLLAAGTALATVAAQNFTINPSEVDKGTRVGWCNAQYNTCSTLCANNPTADSCDPDTLQFVCTCSNGSSPGLIYYTQTLPTFICQQAFSDCIATNTGSSQAQDQCKKNILAKCGTLDPTKAQIGGGSSGTTSGAASPTSSTAGTQSSAAAASSSTHRAAAPTNAAYVGNGVAVVAAAGVLAALL